MQPRFALLPIGGPQGLIDVSGITVTGQTGLHMAQLMKDGRMSDVPLSQGNCKGLEGIIPFGAPNSQNPTVEGSFMFIEPHDDIVGSTILNLQVHKRSQVFKRGVDEA